MTKVSGLDVRKYVNYWLIVYLYGRAIYSHDSDYA